MIIAKDVIDRHNSLVDKLTSLKLSNIPIGKRIVNLMGVHDSKSGQEVNKVNHEVVLYRFCEDLSLIIVVFRTHVQFWSLFEGDKNIAPMLIYTYVGSDIKDICVIDYSNNMFKFIVINDNSNTDFHVDCYNIQIVSVPLGKRTDLYIKCDTLKPTSIFESYNGKFHGLKLSPNKKYAIVTHKSIVDSLGIGNIHIFSTSQLTDVPLYVIGHSAVCKQVNAKDVFLYYDACVHCNTSDAVSSTTPSVHNDNSIVYDIGNRWIAVHMMNPLLQLDIKNDGIDIESNILDATGNVIHSSSDAMRYAFNSMLEAGKYGWNAVLPLLHKNGHTKSASSNSNSNQNMESKPHKGGCIQVFDLESNRSCNINHKNTHMRNNMDSLAKFVAHENDVGCIKFSSSGLNVASSDVHGQVIHIHGIALSSCAATGKNNEKIRPVELLFRLHRGVTYINIIELKFDDRDQVLLASTGNGTIHGFNLQEEEMCGSNSAKGNDAENLSIANTSKIASTVIPERKMHSDAKTANGIASMDAVSTTSPDSVSTEELVQDVERNAESTCSTTSKSKKKKKKESKTEQVRIENNPPSGSDTLSENEADDSYNSNVGSIVSNSDSMDMPRDIIVPSMVNIRSLVPNKHCDANGIGNKSNGSPTRTPIQSNCAYKIRISEKWGAPQHADGNHHLDEKGVYNSNSVASIAVHNNFSQNLASSTDLNKYVIVALTSDGYVSRYEVKYVKNSTHSNISTNPSNPTNPISSTSNSVSSSASAAEYLTNAVSMLQNISHGLYSINCVETNRWELVPCVESNISNEHASIALEESMDQDNLDDVDIFDTSVDESTNNNDSNGSDTSMSGREVKHISKCIEENAKIKRIIWFSNATSYDASRNKHQTDLDISNTYQTNKSYSLPLWRRPNIQFLSRVDKMNQRKQDSSAAIEPAVIEEVSKRGSEESMEIQQIKPSVTMLALLYSKSLHCISLYDLQYNSEAVGLVTSNMDSISLSSYIASVLSHKQVHNNKNNELEESKKEFQLKQEYLKLLRKQQFIANNIQLVELDENVIINSLDINEEEYDCIDSTSYNNNDTWVGLETPAI